MMRKQRAFTLIELMVVMSIFTLVTGIAYTALRLNDNYKDMILVKNDLYHNCKRAMDSIIDELQKSRTEGLITNDTNPDSISFQIPLINSAVSPDYAVEWGADYVGPDSPYHIRYWLNGTNLVRDILKNDLTTVGGTERTIAANITDLDFEQVGVPVSSVRIIVSSQRRALTGGGRPLNMSVESTVYLRN